MGVSRSVHSGSSELESESESESESEDEGVSDSGSFVVVADADSDVPAPSFVLAAWSARVPAMVPSCVGFALCESPCGGTGVGTCVVGAEPFSSRNAGQRRDTACLMQCVQATAGVLLVVAEEDLAEVGVVNLLGVAGHAGPCVLGPAVVLVVELLEHMEHGLLR